MPKASSTKKQKTQKKMTAPIPLGTKRTCTKCATKFYDFGKEDLVCPKCKVKLKATELAKAKYPAAKKPKVVEKIPEVRASDDSAAEPSGSDTFESVEDLADEEESLVGALGGDDGDGSY